MTAYIWYIYIYIWGRDLWGLFRSYLRMLANLIICSHHVLSHFLPCYQSLQRRPLKSKAQWPVFNSQRGDNSQEPPQVHGDPGAQKGKDGERPHRQRWGAGIEKGMSRNMVNTLLKGEHLKPLVQRGCAHMQPHWPLLATRMEPLVQRGGSIPWPKEWNLLARGGAFCSKPCSKRRLLAKRMEPIVQRGGSNSLAKGMEPLVQIRRQNNGTFLHSLVKGMEPLVHRGGTSCPKRQL